MLLPDEADVFLAKRKKRDIKRNAIVSFKAILFIFFFSSAIHKFNASPFTCVPFIVLRVLTNVL